MLQQLCEQSGEKKGGVGWGGGSRGKRGEKRKEEEGRGEEWREESGSASHQLLETSAIWVILDPLRLQTL